MRGTPCCNAVSESARTVDMTIDVSRNERRGADEGDGQGVSPIPAQRRGPRRSRRRCGRGEPSPGADVGGGGPIYTAGCGSAHCGTKGTYQRDVDWSSCVISSRALLLHARLLDVTT